MLLYVILIFLQLLYFQTDLMKDISDRLLCIASYSVKKRITRFHIQFYCSHTRAILSSVMLFFHEQVQLVQTIHYRTILLKIIGERFSESNEGKPAFMFNFVAHVVKEVAKLRFFIIR